MTDEPTLKPCPCCGSNGSFEHHVSHGMTWKRAGCDACGLRTNGFVTRAEAASKWNTRADDGPMRHEAGVALYKDCDPEIRGGAEPDDGPRFRVGDRVRYRYVGADSLGTVEGPAYKVRLGDNYAIAAFESSLEPAPAPLPEDHIDRVWRAGARVVHRSFLEGFISVIDDDWGVRTSGASREWVRHGQQSKTGWSFHESSPIQTPKEP